MNRPKPSLLAVEEALQRVLAGAGPIGTEAVPLEQAGRRILAADIAATVTQPPFDSSAMDGYAVRAQDVGEVPCTLRIIGESAAGHPFAGKLGKGQAARIFTGAPVPDGADAIVIQEDAKRDGDRVTVSEAAKKGAHIRRRGFDFTKGDVLLKAGRCLDARAITLAATMNVAEITVRRRPRVAILATGDELVPLGAPLGPGQIVSSIPFGLAAMIEAAGAMPERIGIAADTHESLAEHLGKAKDCDVLVTIGGASVGEHDLVQQALTAAGMTLDFWKIAMRPGKPLIFGRMGLQRVIGVPGNPVSALICARIFLIPLLDRLLGRETSDSGEKSAILGAPLAANGPRRHYMRATIERGENGTVRAFPVRDQDSSLLTPLASAACLIVRPVEAPPAKAGDPVTILPLDF